MTSKAEDLHKTGESGETQRPSREGEDDDIRDDEDDLITEKLEDFNLGTSDDNEGDEENIFRDEVLGPIQEDPSTQPIGKESAPKSLSKWKTAYENTKHFAGGLISHPFESTKHFSILRHSHGLVFYQGPLTNVAITIFSDEPLPADRTLWLQSKGWTGKTGLKIKTLARASANWTDVTPSAILQPEQGLPPDNRAWERDIDKFLKKAPRQLRKHKPQETAVIRVPHGAQDGYFRIILCAKGSKKSLCPSPVFRVASTGLSSAKFKGASLSTLPVEIGVKILSTMASNAAYNLVSPVTQQVQNQLGQYMPGFWSQEAATSAYTTTGAQSKIDDANERYQMAREGAFEQLEHYAPDLGSIGPLGSDDGPKSPYPMKFLAKVVRGFGEDKKDTGAPSANLKGVPEDVRAKLTGVYFGWASVSLPRSEKDIRIEMLEGWNEAIITVAPSAKAVPTVAPNKEFKVYLIKDLGELEFFDAKMSVMILGYLHPFKPFDSETSTMDLYKDITVTQLSLARSAWSAEAIVEQMLQLKKSRSLTDRYVNARQYGQKQVDKIPLHRFGVRTDSMAVRDKWVGNGGFIIPR